MTIKLGCKSLQQETNGLTHVLSVTPIADLSLVLQPLSFCNAPMLIPILAATSSSAIVINTVIRYYPPHHTSTCQQTTH
jgi:hypothetical protein